MARTSVTRTVSTQKLGDTDVQEEHVSTTESLPPDFALAKLAQLVWFIIYFIIILLALRWLFLLLGANPVGVVRFIYELSNLFILPFRGIFPSPRTGEFFFDSAALLGMLFYYLIGLIVNKALVLFSSSTEVRE